MHEEHWAESIESRLKVLEGETHGKNGILEEVQELQTKVDSLHARVTALLLFGGALLLGIFGSVLQHILVQG